MTVWQMFESTAKRYADRTAIELQRPDTLESWSYRQLYDSAVAWAAWLITSGVRAGDRCGILADNDAAWCAAYLGILRVGAVAVPLDTNYSPSQVATIVGDAAPRVLFVGERLSTVAREAIATVPDVRVVAIDQIPAPGPQNSLLPVAVHESEPAVILYTSGTTADPKGVVLTNANLVAERDAAFQIVSVTAEDSVLGVLPLFHALAQLANLLLPLSVGARVVFLETVNSTELLRALSDRHITIFACVPQFFYLIHQRLIERVARASAAKRWVFRRLLEINFRLRRLRVNAGRFLFARVHAMAGREVRFFVTGGSKFDPAIGRDFYALGFTILQAYGLTETSGAATLTSPHEAHLDTVGRVLPGQQLRILPSDDPELDGEIAIRGPIVMHGYYNRPDATAAVIRDGWFLSGDLGRLDEHGRLFITGRKKDVIVLASGKNIYPEEIEAQYRQSPYVKEICVLGLRQEREPAAERLHAVVVPNLPLMREKRIVNAGDLLRFEMEGQSIHLPPHKRVLGYEIWFEALPRTTTGKLRRREIERRLRETKTAPAAATTAAANNAVWSNDSHATAVVTVLAKRAKTPAIGPDSNLELDLGLDSMERVELLTDLEQEFGVQIAAEGASQIFTVAQLIEAVRPRVDGEGATAAEDSWAVLLRDLPPPDDPVLSGLLEWRVLATPLFFLVSRGLRLLLPRVQASGIDRLPASGPYIISPNHQSYLDPFIVCGVMPFATFRHLFFVGAAEYFETPFMGWLARQCNCVPVDPDARLIPAMKAGAFGLAHGKILMLFPEGERSIDGTVKRFKKGAPILSRQLGVPIVPVAIRGAYEIWPRNRAINWRVLLPWSRHRVHVAFGPPLQFATSDSDAEAAAALQAVVTGMWEGLS